MTTLIERSAAGSTPLAAPPDNRGDAAGVGSPPRRVARRLVARFALIAFGLYHLPLFLNNFPSLGIAETGDNGLAVRWGHVYTPVGVWVARHALGVTAPMPDGLRGDNGDYGEEFGRLLISVAIAAIGALSWTMADRKRPRGHWVEPSLHVLLRYAIILGVASYAVAKILPQQFPPLTAVSLETRIGEVNPAGLLWSFMDYSRSYSFFGGLMELAVILLLCFRRTTTLGALLGLAVMTNVAALNYTYGVQVKLYSTMIVLSAAVLVLYDAPRLFAVFVNNAPAAPRRFASPVLDRIPNVLRWTLKVALFVSVVVSSAVEFQPFKNHDTVLPSGVDGGWRLTSFARDGQRLDSTSSPARWRRFAVDGNVVAIRLESDSLLTCQRTAPPDSNLVRFSCRGNRQGDLRWTRTDDVLRLDGTFDGARVTASGRYLNRSDYRLLRSKFFLILDR